MGPGPKPIELRCVAECAVAATAVVSELFEHTNCFRRGRLRRVQQLTTAGIVTIGGRGSWSRRRAAITNALRADRPAAISPKPLSEAPTAPAEKGPPRSADEERLRRGRVSVRGEQLINFEKTLRLSLAALTSAQKALAIYPVSAETIPKAPAGASELLRVLAEYARRGQEALSRHGVTAAD